MTNSVTNTSASQPAVDQKQVAQMARNYPMQTGWLLAKCDHVQEEIVRVLNALPANKGNALARAQLTELRDYVAANGALFDAIAAEEGK